MKALRVSVGDTLIIVKDSSGEFFLCPKYRANASQRKREIKMFEKEASQIQRFTIKDG
jgi:hypothetical protein